MSLDFDSFVAPPDFGVVDAGAPAVRPPRANEFVRVHPEWVSPEVLLLKQGSKFYLVHHDLAHRLRGHIFKARLVAAASSEAGAWLLWPIKADNESAAAAAEEAKTKWVAVIWQNASKSYGTEAPAEDIADPSWPFSSFAEMAEKAFGDRKISDPEDSILKKILGESAKAES